MGRNSHNSGPGAIVGAALGSNGASCQPPPVATEQRACREPEVLRAVRTTKGWSAGGAVEPTTRYVTRRASQPLGRRPPPVGYSCIVEHTGCRVGTYVVVVTGRVERAAQACASHFERHRHPLRANRIPSLISRNARDRTYVMPRLRTPSSERSLQLGASSPTNFGLDGACEILVKCESC